MTLYIMDNSTDNSESSNDGEEQNRRAAPSADYSQSAPTVLPIPVSPGNMTVTVRSAAPESSSATGPLFSNSDGSISSPSHGSIFSGSYSARARPPLLPHPPLHRGRGGGLQYWNNGHNTARRGRGRGRGRPTPYYRPSTMVCLLPFSIMYSIIIRLIDTSITDLYRCNNYFYYCG